MPFRLSAAIRIAFGLLAVAVLALPAPAQSAVFTDSAGRRVMLPERITRILPAEQNAEVLVYVMAPDKLAGLERLRAAGARPPGMARPSILRFDPNATPESVAQAARSYRADLVIDAGPVTPERAAFADAVQQQSGIPYIMVYDGFNRLQQVFTSLGEIFGVREHADHLRLFFEFDITRVRGRNQIQPADERVRVYYALGADGLTTALPGSPSGAAIDEAGAINVAGRLGRGILARISREQLLSWNPDIIIVQDRRFFNTLRRDRAWRDLSAVRARKVYLEPSEPYGWVSNPPGVNRLIGLYWLSALFQVGPAGLTVEDLRGVTCEFYDRFYRLRLTNAQLDNILEPAGIPRPRAPTPVGQPPPSDRAAVPTAPVIPLVEPAPVIPGTSPGVPGMPSPLPFPTLPEQADALCAIPGIAAPITDLNGPRPSVPVLPGAPGVPVPGSRLRQPGLGGPMDMIPPLPVNPGQ